MRRTKLAAVLLALCVAALLLTACAQDKDYGYQKALAAFADGEYAAAADAFERLGEYADAPTYAAYTRGLTLYDQGRYLEAEPYFEKTQTFMYGEERYRYCHAYAQEAAAAFEEAAAGFDALADFEDAAIHAAYCRARAAELGKNYEDALYDYAAAGVYSDAPARLDNLQTQVYAYAKQLKRERKYEAALKLFGVLGDYFDSAAQTVECKRFFREELYLRADAMQTAGDLQGAYDAFHALAGYNDAEARADELATLLGIPLPTIE
ncbi:MAG: hypothetical protein RR065_04510 [Clostridia bacterium]